LKLIRTGLFWLFCVLLALPSNPAFADTYTYLRCYYRIAPDSPTDVEVANVWARNEKLDGDFQVTGFWWSPGLALANMFYTNIPYQTLKTRCEDTLKSKGITAPLVMFAAADNSKSYNYLIWNVDTKPIDSNKINRIVAFGDSLSDTNNFLNGRGWLDSASNKSYYAGRFTNGKNWLDYLQDYLNVPVYNWAIAGAATEDYYHLPGIKTINGIVSQVDSWITYMDTNYWGTNNVNSNQFYNPQNTLFTVLIGGNDLLTYGIKVDTMISQQKIALTRLINFDEKKAGQKNILLFTLPDLSRTPLFSPDNLIRQLNANDPKTDPTKIKSQLIEFNEKLVQLAADLQKEYPDRVNIQVFDTFAMMNKLLASRPRDYGVTNKTDSCLDVISETLDTYSNAGKFRQSCLDAPQKANSFIYYDLMHPTTHTHKLLARHVFCFIRQPKTFSPVLPKIKMDRSMPDCTLLEKK